jgi:hypothetical protein
MHNEELLHLYFSPNITSGQINEHYMAGACKEHGGWKCM